MRTTWYDLKLLTGLNTPLYIQIASIEWSVMFLDDDTIIFTDIDSNRVVLESMHLAGNLTVDVQEIDFIDDKPILVDSMIVTTKNTCTCITLLNGHHEGCTYKESL